MAKKNPYESATQVDLVKSGNDFFERAYRIIRNSKHKIHLQTYIFSDDSTGLETIKHLTEAVKRGVKVYLLIDAFGSHELKSATIQTIKNNGIHFRAYSPLLTSLRPHFGRRLHHKILIGDDKDALIGGINFDDKYHLAGQGSPWLDYAVFVTGNISEEITKMCERLWSGKGYFRRKKRNAAIQSPIPHNHPITVKLQQNDWLYGKKGISRSINNSIRHANVSATLLASYFLPGGRMRRSLKNASKRNVKVKIILAGLSDVKIVKYATSYWYAWLLRNNIELYEWNKTILHGKIVLVDNNWVSIGSYNINHLSHYSSIETNLEVKDEPFSKIVKAELDDVMSQCKRITSNDNWKRANPIKMFLWWSSFQLVRFLFWFQFAILSKE